MGLPASWREIESDRARYCLGELAVTDTQIEEDKLVSIELRQVSGSGFGDEMRETFVVFAGLENGRWHFTWPIPLGPELHQEDPQ